MGVNRSKSGGLPIQLQVSAVCCTGSPGHEYEHAAPLHPEDRRLRVDLSSQHRYPVDTDTEET
jgi:hypothetical protein